MSVEYPYLADGRAISAWRLWIVRVLVIAMVGKMALATIPTAEYVTFVGALAPIAVSYWIALRVLSTPKP